MKPIKAYLFIFIVLATSSWHAHIEHWSSKKYKTYTLYYTSADSINVASYHQFIDNGIRDVKKFFNISNIKKFGVYIHPTRQSLDSTWRQDWRMPNFKSECWMVASGVAKKLDMIAPKKWDAVACEHTYADKLKTQQLITHELFHVFHGQLNISPDFSDVDNIDWFVEGLATYASGQCDTARLNEIKKAVQIKKIPASLNNFWMGKLKYGLSGSVVLFIDKKYGRKKLKELLPFNKKVDILKSLHITETQLLNEWASYILTM